MSSFSAIVSLPDGESSRLDSYIASMHHSDLTRSRLKNEATKMLVNGISVKLAKKVYNKDTLYIEWEDPIPKEIQPQNIPLQILYEDDDVTVVNKKQGMVTHPANGNWEGTLVNALLFHWGQGAADKENVRPGIVHRLDKDTSGVIITAKHRKAEEWLQRQFFNKRTKKIYIAIVHGCPTPSKGEIKTTIARHKHNRKIFMPLSVDSQKGKFAWTQYKTLATFGHYSIILLKIKTGRTHQIRVHLKHIGCPILGDPLYNKPDSRFKNIGLMLHARKLCIKLPGKSEYSEFKAPLPLHLKNVIVKLRGMYE